MIEKILFMGEGDMDNTPPGAESFRRLPQVEGKDEVKGPRSRVKDITSSRRTQQPSLIDQSERPLSADIASQMAKKFGGEDAEEQAGALDTGVESVVSEEPRFTPAPDEERGHGEEQKKEEGEVKEDAHSEYDEVFAKLESGDKDGAYEKMCEVSGMDPESSEAKDAFDKMSAVGEEASKPHEHQDLDTWVDYLKSLPPKTRGALAHSMMLKAGWDDYEINKALRLASEVSPAPLSEEDDGGAGGIGAAPPEGEAEGEAKIGPTPLDEELAKALADADAEDDPEKAKEGLLAWLREHNGGPGAAVKDTLKVAYFLAVTAVFAYILALKTLGGGMSKAAGGK